MNTTDVQVLRKAIKRIILTAEKKLSINDYYGISNVVSPEELNKIYTTLDGLVYEGRRFKVVLKMFVEGDYRSGAQIHYTVTDKQTKAVYSVIHYGPNRHFDNTFGWFIEEKEAQKK